MAKVKFEKKSAFEQAAQSKIEDAQEKIQTKINNNELQNVLISEIVNPSKHDRVGYEETAIIEMATNMKEVGLLQPIIIRKLADGTLERIIGFRRILSAKYLGWKTIKSIVLENIDDDTAALMMLSENLHKEDPNIYDQTVKIIEYLSHCVNKTEEDVKKLLFKLRNYDGRKLKEITEEEKDTRDLFEAALEKTVKITISTLVDRLRVFSLDEKLIQAMRKDGLSYTNAKELNKVKKLDFFQELLEYTVNEKPTKSELIKTINEYKTKDAETPLVNKDELLVSSLSKELKIKKLKKLDNNKYKEVIKHLDLINKIICE